MYGYRIQATSGVHVTGFREHCARMCVHSNMRRYASPHIQAYTYVSLLAMIFSATNSQKYAALRLGRVQWHTDVCALQLQTIIAAFKQQRSRPITPGSGQRILPYCFFFIVFIIFLRNNMFGCRNTVIRLFRRDKIRRIRDSWHLCIEIQGLVTPATLSFEFSFGYKKMTKYQYCSYLHYFKIMIQNETASV